LVQPSSRLGHIGPATDHQRGTIVSITRYMRRHLREERAFDFDTISNAGPFARLAPRQHRTFSRRDRSLLSKQPSLCGWQCSPLGGRVLCGKFWRMRFGSGRERILLTIQTSWMGPRWRNWVRMANPTILASIRASRMGAGKNNPDAPARSALGILSS
jgi:hypothetical protein